MFTAWDREAVVLLAWGCEVGRGAAAAGMDDKAAAR
jgi:hypothetical protein